VLSKSFKQIFMDWTYEKYLRHQELQVIEDGYSCKYRPIFGLVSLLDYPVQSANKILFPTVAGFQQHPKSSEEM